MYISPNVYDRLNCEVDNIEMEEFYPSVTVDLIHNSSEFEAFAQGVVN